MPACSAAQSSGQTTTTGPGLQTLNNFGGFTGNNVGAVAGSILRLASSTDSSANFVAYDPVVGFVTASPASSLTNTFSGSTPATIANITSATSISGTADIFGLTTTANISNGTLRLRSMNANDMGALIFNGTSTLSSNVIVNGSAASVNLTGAVTTSTSTTVGVPTTAGLVVGMPVPALAFQQVQRSPSIVGGATITISAAATATATGVTLTVNPATTGASEGIVYVKEGSTATMSGNVDGRTITRQARAISTMTGSNGVYGPITVNNGTLTLGSSAATKQTTGVVLNDTGRLNVNGGNTTVASLSGTVGTVGNAAATPGTLTISGITNTTFFGNIVNTIGAGSSTTGLIKNGTSTLTLGNITANNTYAGQNSFTGGVVLNQGILIAQDPLALGGANGSTPGTVTLNGGTLQLNSNGGGPNGTIIYGNPTGNGLNLAATGYATLNVDRVGGTNTGNQVQVGNSLHRQQHPHPDRREQLLAQGGRDHDPGRCLCEPRHHHGRRIIP